MAKTKLLNIDKVAPKQERKIILNDKEYAVKDMTVEMFLELAEFEKKNAQTENLADTVRLMIEFTKKFVPDLEEEVLYAATSEQLAAIVNFIRNNVPDEETESVESTDTSKDETETK